MVTVGVTRHTDVSKDGTPASCPLPSKQSSLSCTCVSLTSSGQSVCSNCSSEELRDQVAVVSYFCSPTAAALSLKVLSRTHPPIASSALRVRYEADDVLRDNMKEMKTFLKCLICNLAEVSSGRSRAGTVLLRQRWNANLDTTVFANSVLNASSTQQPRS